MTIHLRVAAALLLLLFIAGCGQSGPLYIPGNPSTVQLPPDTADTQEEEDEDADPDR